VNVWMCSGVKRRALFDLTLLKWMNPYPLRRGEQRQMKCPAAQSYSSYGQSVRSAEDKKRTARAGIFPRDGPQSRII
jgi:hypothetical protein